MHEFVRDRLIEQRLRCTLNHVQHLRGRIVVADHLLFEQSLQERAEIERVGDETEYAIDALLARELRLGAFTRQLLHEKRGDVGARLFLKLWRRLELHPELLFKLGNNVVHHVAVRTVAAGGSRAITRRARGNEHGECNSQCKGGRA